MTELYSIASAGSSVAMDTHRNGDPPPGAPGAAERRAKHLPGAPPHAPATSEELRRELDELRARHDALAISERELRAQLDALGQMGLRLEAERERYADLFEHAPDAFVVTDRFGVVRDANAAAAALFSIEIRFLRGKSLSAFVDPTTVEEMHDALDRLDRERPRLIDFTLRPRGGGDVPVRARVAFTSRGPNLLWTLRESACSAGVAGSRELSRALRDQEELLARERRMREELERVDRVKDRFIAVLSHDLRAPLSAILGWAQLLRRGELGPEERDRALSTIERNARMQANLVEELLDVSRMSADRIQLALGPIDAGTVAQRAVEGALPKARELGLAMTFGIEPELTIVADRQRLEQILANLLSNAMKYTSAPGRIEVLARRAGGRVELVVRDTGRGIAPDLLPYVFEMYTQERSYASSRNGLGLGLFIVKQLVELQQGTVRAESAGVGRGATFTVSFPLEDGAVAAPSVRALAATTTLGHLRVLVVDDDEDSRDLMASILGRAGADVECAASIDAALEVHRSFAPDVVVSDLAMPGGDGCELVRKLRARDAGIAALAVTGFTSQRDADRAIAAGFDMHVGKPLDAAELVDAVHEASRSRR